jgi:hypothetical protein
MKSLCRRRGDSGLTVSSRLALTDLNHGPLLAALEAKDPSLVGESPAITRLELLQSSSLKQNHSNLCTGGQSLKYNQGRS